MIYVRSSDDGEGMRPGGEQGKLLAVCHFQGVRERGCYCSSDLYEVLVMGLKSPKRSKR